MPADKLKSYSRDNANRAIGRLEEKHARHISEAASSRFGIKFGSITLAAAGVVAVLEKSTDLIPQKIDAYTYVALAIGAGYAISGYFGNRMHKEGAAREAAVAIHYAIPNEIELPEWIEPYKEENAGLIDRLQTENEEFNRDSNV